jgi:DNA (cytosine-5)-methyltransferase 1
MFAGIGGFRLGLEKANQVEGWGDRRQFTDSTNSEVRARQSLGRKTNFKTVWANELDKYACQIYRKHYGTAELVEGDIREIPTETIPDFDLLTAGFPCQSFSLAGKRKGTEESRGTLFAQIVRVAHAKRPSLLLLENVKGLLSSDDGGDFAKILRALGNLGYLLEWQVLNSKYFGVPQNRERVFIVGHLGEECSRQVFPIGEACAEFDEPCREAQGEGQRVRASDSLRSTYYKGYATRGPLIANTLSHRYGKDGSENLIAQLVGDRDNPTLSVKNEAFCLPSNPMSDRQQVVVEHKKITERTGEYGTGFKDGEVFCLDSSSGHDQVLHLGQRIRRLTPVECERLQGFPDGWTEGVSDTQRYKCLGNAVTVPVIQFLGEKLRGLFLRIKETEGQK